MPKTVLSIRAIEKRLVGPYRRDTEKREKLFAALEQMEAKIAEEPVAPKPKLQVRKRSAHITILPMTSV